MNGSNHDQRANGKDALTTLKRGSDAAGNIKKPDRSKRLRVSRACDQCRAGREKCDGEQPVCNTCQTQSRTCSYNEQPKKRGIQPNYIRTLELTLQWMLQLHPEGRRELSYRLPESSDRVQQILAFKDVAAAEELHQSWRNGIICRQIDQLLSGSEIEDPETETVDRPAIDITGSSNREPNETVHQSSARNLQAEQALKQNFEPNLLPARIDTTCGERLVLPDNAWELLEHYFAFTQTFLPITEKHDLLKLMYSYSSGGVVRDQATASEHAELWSIMAWSSYRDAQEIPKVGEYQTAAKELVPQDGNFQLNHAKALLVLTLIDMAKSSWATAWMTIGFAIRVLTQLIAGVPLEMVSTSGRMRHTILAAFLLETTIAAKTGAIAHLSPGIVQTIGLPIEDGIEEWSPWSDPATMSAPAVSKSPARSISTFNELIRGALKYRCSDAQDKSYFDVIPQLLQNAASSKSRQNPSTLLMQSPQSEAGSESSLTRKQAVASQTVLPNAEMTRPIGFAREVSHTPVRSLNHLMSIPNRSAESVSGSTPAQGTMPAESPNMWLGHHSVLSPYELLDLDRNQGTVETSTNIFEELAMLDPAEENPQFMQNLGFGPDLDLAEFFGDDYLPSDPQLMYAQPGAQLNVPDTLRDDNRID